MQAVRVKTQRWSDGLVSFQCLGDKDVKCQMNGVFALFCLAGTLCLMGLASKTPIRGAIEVTWGVELHPGELYGASVARAYELESEVAQYPRIVLGNGVINFLNSHANNLENDVFSQNDCELAKLCLNMLVQDVDGNWCVHYLGDFFQEHIGKSSLIELYSLARNYVTEQLEKYRGEKNTKLAFRYAQLWSYFAAHVPVDLVGRNEDRVEMKC